MKNLIFGIFAAVMLFAPVVGFGADVTGSNSVNMVTVSGTLTDSGTKQALSYASVSAKNTRFGGMSDENGKYSVNVPINSTLEFTYLGYKPQEKKVGQSNARIDITLEKDAKLLDEAVVSSFNFKRMYYGADSNSGRFGDIKTKFNDKWDGLKDNISKSNDNLNKKLSNLKTAYDKLVENFNDEMEISTMTFEENGSIDKIDGIKGLVADIAYNAEKKQKENIIKENEKIPVYTSEEDFDDKTGQKVFVNVRAPKDIISVKEHDANKKAYLDSLATKYNNLMNDLRDAENARNNACADAIRELESDYQKRWDIIATNARDTTNGTAFERAEKLKSDKAALDNGFKKALESLPECSGLEKKSNFLGLINSGYDALLKELSGAMSAAEKACSAEKETLLKDLQNKWDAAQKIARDNRAEPEAGLRKESARKIIEPAIADYRTKMTELYKTGKCAGVGTPWAEPNDKPFQKVISGWADLQRQLDGEDPVDYQDEKKLAELKTAAADARATEQSRANRLLGGAATALGGIGGMQLMQGIAEKQSDKEGADEMRAYTETFRCGVGNTMNVRSDGQPQIVPGYTKKGTELKNEYTEKVLFLTSRKAALGMMPGIEAETILNTDNLYSSESMNGAVANRFDTAQQRLDSGDANRRMLIGGGALALGVVGGAVGDMLINKKSDTEKTDIDKNKTKDSKQDPNKKTGGVDLAKGAASMVGAGGAGAVVKKLTGQEDPNKEENSKQKNSLRETTLIVHLPEGQPNVSEDDIDLYELPKDKTLAAVSEDTANKDVDDNKTNEAKFFADNCTRNGGSPELVNRTYVFQASNDLKQQIYRCTFKEKSETNIKNICEDKKIWTNVLKTVKYDSNKSYCFIILSDLTESGKSEYTSPYQSNNI